MFKFSIRDLLWLTVVVALGVGWWCSSLALRDATRHSEYLEEAIDSAGFVPSGDYLGPNLMSQKHLRELLKIRAQAERLEH